MGEKGAGGSVKRGFFKELLHRRVLQITGFYLGGGWGVLQFLDWIVERYLLSPLLVDLALTIIVSLLPTIATIAYFHGIPGKNKWRKREKILVPVNLAFTIVLLIVMFGTKDLGSVAKRVSVVDEEGHKIEQLVPKKGIVKDLVIFFFDNETGDKELNWLQYSLSDMLIMDISQDPFISVLYPFTPDVFKGYFIYQKFKDAGFPDATGAPLMLKKKIASDLKSEYFLSGAMIKAADGFEVNVKVYNSRDNSIAAEKILTGKDVFTVVDALSVFIKKTMKLPSYKNREIIDLPVKEMFTGSEKAARLFTEGGIEVVKNNDYTAAQKYFENALKEDSTFTIAYSQLSEIYALNNRTDLWKSTVKEMMKHLYKVPEKMQMHFRAGYYLSVKGEPEKAESVLKMIIKLYPNDIKSYFTLASRLAMTGDYKESIPYYQKILELDPGQHEIYNKIGNAYENLGDLKTALRYYGKFSGLFPNDVPGLLRVGSAEEKLGNFKKALGFYEKALLLDPERTNTLLSLAGLDIKAGRFDQAHEKYRDALESAKNHRERSSIYGVMDDFFRLRGQNKLAMEMIEKLYQSNEKYSPPLQVLIVKLITTDIFLKNGREKEIKLLLDESVIKLSPPFDKIVSVGYIAYYKHLGRADKAESYLADIEDFVKVTGNKQFLFLLGRRKGDIARLKGEMEQALAHYKRILEQDKNSITIHMLIANCLDELGKREEALEYINQSLKFSPFHPELNYTAGLLHTELNNPTEAVRRLELAMKGWENADRDFKPAQRAVQLLKSLNAGK